MSWSVSSSGKVPVVKAEIERQFLVPLSVPPIGVSDEGERETLRRISETISQCLSTFDPEKDIVVSASGHMGFTDWDKKTGAYQEVSLTIR